MKNQRIFNYTFGNIYKLYLEKLARKERSKEDLDKILSWLTGYSLPELVTVIEEGLTLEQFFAQAPAMNPNTYLITGVICGYRVEDMEDPLMQKIRYMDKLVDELYKGKKMEKILRVPK